MSINTITTIYQCGEGHNIILLDENLENMKIEDLNEVECPACGSEIVGGMVREIEIKN